MAALKLFIILAILMLILWRGKPLYLAAITGTILIGLFFWLPLADWLKLVLAGAVANDTINILVTFFAIMLLEKYLDNHGFLQKMLTGLQEGFRRRKIVLGTLPALIGFIPSAGGALFSAPMVEQATKGLNMKPEEKTLINFYFRHVFEMYLPIYPALIVVTQLTGLPFKQIFWAVLPMGIVNVLLGLPYLKAVPKAKTTPELTFAKRKNALKNLLLGTGPIITVLLLILIFNMPIWLSVSIVLIPMLIYTKDYRPQILMPLIKGAVQWKTLLMVFTLMIFKEMLMNSGAMASLPKLLGHSPIPFFLAMAVFAYFVNMLTGMNLATMAICLPVAIVAGSGSISLAMTTLIIVTSFAGGILTPMHLCLPITAQYFKADMSTLIRKLVPPSIALAISAVCYYILLAHFGL